MKTLHTTMIPIAVAHNPKWMKNLNDDLKLSELSLPGTHDTMALYESVISGSKAFKHKVCLLLIS